MDDAQAYLEASRRELEEVVVSLADIEEILFADPEQIARMSKVERKQLQAIDRCIQKTAFVASVLDTMSNELGSSEFANTKRLIEASQLKSVASLF